MRERWKQAGLTCLTLLAVAIAVAAYMFVLSQAGNQSAFIGHVGLAIVSFVAYLAAVKWIERRAPAELSFRSALPAFGVGLLAGAAQFSLLMAILWIAGAYRAQGWNGFDGLALAFVFWLAVGVREEILYRGLLYRLFSRIIGTWGALFLSGAVFGATHMNAPGWTVPGLLSVALAGVMFGAAYTATGRLWLPIGLHTAWNFVQSSVFGLSVSGNDMGSGAIAGTLKGPDYLTGGPFGPEATIVTAIILLATASYFMWRIAKLGRAEPPIWRGAKGTAAATAPA